MDDTDDVELLRTALADMQRNLAEICSAYDNVVEILAEQRGRRVGRTERTGWEWMGEDIDDAKCAKLIAAATELKKSYAGFKKYGHCEPAQGYMNCWCAAVQRAMYSVRLALGPEPVLERT